MYAEERRRQIASLTAVEGRVNVTELSERFEVTAETIRRDLAVLDREGVVHRVHGGAVASQSFQTAELTLKLNLILSPIACPSLYLWRATVYRTSNCLAVPSALSPRPSSAIRHCARWLLCAPTSPSSALMP